MTIQNRTKIKSFYTFKCRVKQIKKKIQKTAFLKNPSFNYTDRQNNMSSCFASEKTEKKHFLFQILWYDGKLTFIYRMEKNNIYEMEAMDHGGAGSVSSVFCPYGCNFDKWNKL